MRVHIVVTADDGITYEGDVELVASSPSVTPAPARKVKAKAKAAATPPSAGEPDFELPCVPS